MKKGLDEGSLHNFDIQTVIQPCMWFLHDGTGQGLYSLASGELAWHIQNHIQGWMNDLKMLLSCFRTKMSGRLQWVGEGGSPQKNSDFTYGEGSPLFHVPNLHLFPGADRKFGLLVEEEKERRKRTSRKRQTESRVKSNRREKQKK